MKHKKIKDSLSKAGDRLDSAYSDVLRASGSVTNAVLALNHKNKTEDFESELNVSILQAKEAIDHLTKAIEIIKKNIN